MAASADAGLVTMEDLRRAERVVRDHHLPVRTPLLSETQHLWGLPVRLYLKMESAQTGGSFKVRGVVNQMMALSAGIGSPERPIVTMSAGNYGRAFAMIAKDLGLLGTVVMPVSAPDNREVLMRELGCKVVRVPTSQLQQEVDRLVTDENMVYLHPFNDRNIIAGNGTSALEVLEEVQPDVVVVPCGGGALVSGVSSAVKLMGLSHCRVYAVEPEGSQTMYQSVRSGRPVAMEVNSVAAGLSPPFATDVTLRHVQAHVEEVILVRDAEIVVAMAALERRGLRVEPSGAAGFAALQQGRVPDVEGRRVVVWLTGGNVTPEELSEIYGKAKL